MRALGFLLLRQGICDGRVGVEARGIGAHYAFGNGHAGHTWLVEVQHDLLVLSRALSRRASRGRALRRCTTESLTVRGIAPARGIDDAVSRAVRRWRRGQHEQGAVCGEFSVKISRQLQSGSGRRHG